MLLLVRLLVVLVGVVMSLVVLGLWLLGVVLWVRVVLLGGVGSCCGVGAVSCTDLTLTAVWLG